MNNEWEGRYGSVTWMLMAEAEPGLPLFQLDATSCKVLREGFQGAYQFEVTHGVGPERIFHDRPKKDGYSHIQDALQYAALRYKQLYRRGELKK